MLDLLEAHVKFSVRLLAQSPFVFTAIPESQSTDVFSRRPAHRPYTDTSTELRLWRLRGRQGIPPTVPQVLHYSVSLSVGKETAPTLYGWGGVSEMMSTTNSHKTKSYRQERKRQRRYKGQCQQRPLEEVSEWSEPETKEVQCCCTLSSVSRRHYYSM